MIITMIKAYLAALSAGISLLLQTGKNYIWNI